MAVSLYLQGRNVLLVGDHPNVQRFCDRLERVGASTTRVSPEAFGAHLCADAYLVVAYTTSNEQNRSIADVARQHHCLVYAHDLPEVSDLAMPARVQRGALTIAISTDGLAPTLARQFKNQLGSILDDAGPKLDQLMTSLAQTRARLPFGSDRTRVLTAMASRLRLRGQIDVESDSCDESGEKQR